MSPPPSISSGSSIASSPVGTFIPPGSLSAWQTAKRAAQARTGVAGITIWGASIACGQSSGAVTDVLAYGWPGRLDAILSAQLGGAIEGYTIAGLNPPTLTSPSTPYSTPAQHTVGGGPFGQPWSMTLTGSTWLTITIPVHPITGAAPTSVDLFSVDVITQANGWQATKGSGGTTSVNVAGPGVGSIGAGILRRTTIALTGADTLAIQQNNANALVFIGHAVTYAASGLAMMRAAVPGFRGIDYATGGGIGFAAGANNGVVPDGIKPWTGVADAFNTAGGGFPFNSALHIVADIPGNDVIYGASPEKLRKVIVRLVSAARRSSAAAPGSIGASVILLADPSFDGYSDNFAAIGNAQSGATYESARYKDILYAVAAEYGCVYIDLGQVFGETPVARGLVASGFVHPTQNGGGAGGNDGHLLIAQTLAGGSYLGSQLVGVL